jgi:hypothetical protein
MPKPWRSLSAISVRPHPRRLVTAQCPHLPGRTGVTRSVSSTPGHRDTVARDEENDTSELDAEVFGSYSVILPPEPFIFGVSHIPQRPVPSHIARPPYVTTSAHGQPVPSGDGRIQLGSPAEWRLRRAAQLAREVLEYAGTLVKVRVGIVVFRPR